jgi:acyl-CoA thioesterase-1
VVTPIIPASVPAATSSPAPYILIDAEGDSTMHGYQWINGAPYHTQNCEPCVLQRLLWAIFPGGVGTENNGVDGTTVLMWQAIHTPYTTDKSKIVIGNWGINDAWQGVSSPDQYQSQLVEFVTEVRAAGQIPVLEEPNPTTQGDNLAEYVEKMDYVALQMNVPLVQQYNYILSLPNWVSMLTDGIHPGDALYAIKAQREFDVISPIVKSMQ